MKDILNALVRKLSSRKFWMAIAVVVSGVSIAMGNDAGTIQSAAGTVAAMIGGVVYIITEGKVDAAHIGDIAKQAEDVKEAIDSTND